MICTSRVRSARPLAGLDWLRRRSWSGTVIAGPRSQPSSLHAAIRRELRRLRGAALPAGTAREGRRTPGTDAGRERLHGPERRPGRRGRHSSLLGQQHGRPNRCGTLCRSILARATGSRAAAGIRSTAAVAGGDDYELLFAVPAPKTRPARGASFEKRGAFRSRALAS